MAAISDPWNDVGHKVGVDPIDDACIDIGHLKQGGDLRISGTAIDPDHIRHPPTEGFFRSPRCLCLPSRSLMTSGGTAALGLPRTRSEKECLL